MQALAEHRKLPTLVLIMPASAKSVRPHRTIADNIIRLQIRKYTHWRLTHIDILFCFRHLVSGAVTINRIAELLPWAWKAVRDGALLEQAA